MKNPPAILAFLVILVFGAGCATVVPPELAKEVTPGLTLAKVMKQPGQYKGKTVLWGGRILRSVNKAKGTLIEVLEQPLDYDDRPRQTDQTQGRFIVSMKGYLETALYHRDREVTVVGEVVGVESLPLGEIKYKYVLLRGKEVNLWPKPPLDMRVPGPSPWVLYGPPPPYPYWYNGPYMWW